MFQNPNQLFQSTQFYQDSFQSEFFSEKFFQSAKPNEKKTQDDNRSRAKAGQILLLHRHISKNLLFVVLPYLKCNEINALLMSSKRIYEKTISDPYLKTIMIQAYMGFFLQQFVPPSQEFVDKVHSLGSISTASRSILSHQQVLPVTKEDFSNKHYKTYDQEMIKDLRDDLFELSTECTFWKASDYESLVAENELIFNELHTLYQKLVAQKQNFMQAFPNYLEDEYMMNIENFAREMLLDPSECENAFFILPQLTRDSFSKKGLFYRTDKILIQNYSTSFQFPSAGKVKENLLSAQSDLEEIVSSPQTQASIQRLINLESSSCYDIDMEESQKARFSREVLKYVFFQFRVLCYAHKLELFRIKQQVKGKSPFVFLQGFIELQQHLNVLLKKITMNVVMQEAFAEYLVNQNVATKEQLMEREYLADNLFLNILDQIWIQDVYEPHQSDLVQSFQFEFKLSHDIDRIDELFVKRNILAKINKIIEATERNQEEKRSFALLVNPNYQMIVSSKDCIQQTIQEAITSILVKAYESSQSLSEFCREIKRFEQTKILFDDYQNFYYQEKSNFILMSFAKELKQRICQRSRLSQCSEFTVYQIVPQDLQGSFFFRVIQSLLKVNKKEFDNAAIKQAIFMAIHIDQNAKWAEKLNNQMLKCHEKFNKSQLVLPEQSEEEITEFEELFVNVARQVEVKYDFEEQIKQKKEAEKTRMIKEIQERLSLITGPDAENQPFINSHLSRGNMSDVFRSPFEQSLQLARA